MFGLAPNSQMNSFSAQLTELINNYNDISIDVRKERTWSTLEKIEEQEAKFRRLQADTAKWRKELEDLMQNSPAIPNDVKLQNLYEESFQKLLLEDMSNDFETNKILVRHYLPKVGKEPR